MTTGGGYFLFCQPSSSSGFEKGSKHSTRHHGSSSMSNSMRHRVHQTFWSRVQCAAARQFCCLAHNFTRHRREDDTYQPIFSSKLWRFSCNKTICNPVETEYSAVHRKGEHGLLLYKVCANTTWVVREVDCVLPVPV